MKFFKTAANLQEHQKRVLQKLEDSDAVIVYHGLGSGKTLTSLAAGEKIPTTVIAPASLKENFHKEVKKHKLKTKPQTYSYNKPPENKNLSGLLIFDEAHRMGRLESLRSKYPDEFTADKKLFLTGTPIRNEPAELIPLLRGVGINTPRDRVAFNNKYIERQQVKPGFFASLFKNVKPGEVRKPKNLKEIKNNLKGKIDYYAPSTEDYPRTSTSNIFVQMTPNQFDAYKMALKGRPDLAYKLKHGIPPSKAEVAQMNSFLTATRQISNTPKAYTKKEIGIEDMPKIERMVSEILERAKSDKNYRGVSYSNYLESGVEPLAKYLEEAGISTAKFTGKLNEKQKKQLIEDYNSGKIQQLLISSAGGEGLDLKGTKLIQVMEPHWNDPTISQVLGRAIRYKSHDHLPEDERQVVIQKYYAKPRPSGFIKKKQHMGTDEYLQMLSNNKTKLNEQFLEALREASKS